MAEVPTHVRSTEFEGCQFQRLMSYIVGNQASWFTAIGLKAGLFRAIDDAGGTGVTDEALAERLGYHPRYVQVWCLGAYAFELLDWDEESGYRLAPHLTSLLLDSADPQFMGGRMLFYTALYEDYLAFPEHLQTGDVWPRSDHDPFILRALQAMTTPDCVMITEQVLPQVPDTVARLESGGRVLDIGSGGGAHVVHYAQRFPDAHVVGMEFDEPSIDNARRAVSDAAVGDRVEIVHGDANALDAGGAFDLVTMNLTLHETGGIDEYRNVLDRVRRALKPGGTVVVSEIPYPDEPTTYRSHPVYKAIAGVQLHEALVGCGMITQGRLGELLDDAGFANVRVATQPMPTRHVMIGANADNDAAPRSGDPLRRDAREHQQGAPR
jgi:SAM-dependent methyltransferase